MKYCYFIALVLVTTACSSNTDIEIVQHSFNIDSTGIQIIAVNTGGPKDPDPLFEVELLHRITESSSDVDKFLVGPLRTPYLDESGGLFVADHGRVAIAAFDSTGAFLHWMGGRGNGPGEFMQPYIQEVAKGIISIYDRIQHRVTEYSYAGRLRDVYKLTFPSSRERELHRTPSGDLISIQEHSRTKDGYDSRQIRVVAFSASEDTLWYLMSEWMPVSKAAVFRYSGSTPLYTRSDISFASIPVGYFAPGRGVFFVGSALPLILCYSLFGELELEVKLDVRGSVAPDLLKRTQQVAARSARAHVADMRRRLEKSGGSTEHVPHWRETFEVRTDPGWCGGVMLAGDGSIWVPYPFFTGEQQLENGIPHRVISAEGEYLGDVHLPARGGSVGFNRYAVVERDKDTGAWVPTVYRLIPSDDGLN